MEFQEGDENFLKFSFGLIKVLEIQCVCYIMYMNIEIYDLLREGFDCFLMFNGVIKSSGFRYCLSIEDKINCFVDRDCYQIFVEFEGWNIVEIYVNGFFISLLEDV